MLVAVSAAGQRQVASAQVRAESFTCPACGGELVVRVPANRVAHFAHLPGRKCPAQLSRAARRAQARQRAAERRAQGRLGAFAAAGQQSLFELDEAPGA